MKKTGFVNFRRRLFQIVFFVPACFLLAISLTTSITTYSLYKNSFNTAFRSDMSLLTSRFEIAHSRINAKISAVSTANNTKKAASSYDQSLLSEILRNLVISDQNFLGGIYYSTDGRKINSPEISGAPEFSELLEDKSFSSFYNSNSVLLSSIRNERISDAYHTYPYDEKTGILSFFQKVVDDEKTLGVIEIDISTADFYEQNLSLESHNYMEESTIILTYDTCQLKNPESDVSFSLNDISLENPQSSGSYYAMRSDVNTSESIFSIYVFTPKKNFTNLIITINVSIIIAQILLDTFFFFSARHYSQKESARLKAIEDKMSSDSLIE